MIIFFLSCQPEPSLTRFFLSLESESTTEIQLHIATLEMRQENTSFYDPWEQLVISTDGSVFINSNSLTQIGYGELMPPNSYLQTFVDVDQIFLETQPLIDIVEAIATPVKIRRHHEYDIAITLAIIEDQLFAVDSNVIETDTRE